MPFVLYMIYFPVLFAEWLLNCFADAPPQYIEDEIKGDVSKASAPTTVRGEGRSAGREWEGDG